MLTRVRGKVGDEVVNRRCYADLSRRRLRLAQIRRARDEHGV